MMGPLQRRAIRSAYYDGVIDALQYPTPSPGKREGGSRARRADSAQRQGWFDGDAKRALRAYEFSAREVLRRVEIREAAGRSA